MSFYSYSSTSFSSSQTHNGQTSGQSYSAEQRSDPRGTAVRTTTQNNPREPALQELRYFDARGNEVPAEMAATRGLQGVPADNSRRIEDVSDSSHHPQAVDRVMREREADRRYRELMEDEYARREGGA